MKLTLIVAYADNRVIGRDNDLPWKLPGDLNHFKKSTLGHPIIMGRKTRESLGRPLPGRTNVVISRNTNYHADGAVVVSSLQGAVGACGAVEQAFVIGGAQIYAQALPLAQTVMATEVHAQVKGDAFFPALLLSDWQETVREAQSPENGYAYDFVTYVRKPN